MNKLIFIIIFISINRVCGGKTCFLRTKIENLKKCSCTCYTLTSDFNCAGVSRFSKPYFETEVSVVRHAETYRVSRKQCHLPFEVVVSKSAVARLPSVSQSTMRLLQWDKWPALIWMTTGGCPWPHHTLTSPAYLCPPVPVPQNLFPYRQGLFERNRNYSHRSLRCIVLTHHAFPLTSIRVVLKSSWIPTTEMKVCCFQRWISNLISSHVQITEHG